MRLDPYLVLIGTRDRASRAVVTLRAGGYQVTKLPESEAAAREAVLLKPDAIVLDLPPLHANRVARQLSMIAPSTPLLVVTSLPAFVNVPAIPRAEIDSSLISTVDRLLAGSVAGRIAS